MANKYVSSGLLPGDSGGGALCLLRKIYAMTSIEIMTRRESMAPLPCSKIKNETGKRDDMLINHPLILLPVS